MMSPWVVVLIMLLVCAVGGLVIVVARLEARITRLEWDRWGSLAKYVKPLRNWEDK